MKRARLRTSALALALCAGLAVCPAFEAHARQAAAQAGAPPPAGTDPFAPVNGNPPPKLPKGAFPSGPRPPDHVARAVSAALALEMAQTAVAACAPQHVGVSILDAEGNPKLYYIPDGTAGMHAYTGFRKAYTALHFKVATSEIHKRVQTDDALDKQIAGDPNLVSWAGGLPIVVNGEVIGAIGVSGAEPSETDEACAKAGLDKVQSRLR